MSMIATRYVKEPVDVEARLAELGTSLATLLEIRDIATSASGNATPFHAANAGGTFAYQDGTWALRDRHVTDGMAAFYFMVDSKGACELTRPVVKGGTFTSYVERIYLSTGIDLDSESLVSPENGPITNFDPEVVRKT